MNEPLGVLRVRLVQRALTLARHLLNATEVHVGRREQGQALVVMMVPVPEHEVVAP